MAAVVIELDALPFLSGFEGFNAVAGHNDVHMVVDVGKGIVPKVERLGAVDEDIIELLAIAEGVLIDLLHTFRKFDLFQDVAVGKRMVADVHDGAGQGDTSEVDATVERLAADVADPIRLPIDGFRFRNDHVTRIGIWIVVVDNDQIGLATTASWKLLRDFAVIDAIDIVIIGECTLVNHHECQGQKRKDKCSFHNCNY